MEASDSIVQIGHLFGRNGVSKNFTIRAAKCRSGYKQGKAS